MSTPDLGPTRDVHFLQFPVDVWARSQQHHDELFREFALIAAGAATSGEGHGLPTRLTQLIEALTQQFAGVGDEAEERLYDAARTGVQTIDDHVMTLPEVATDASRILGEMLDEADDYCRQGEHLLTLATPDDLVRFRWWYLDQVIDQLEGKPAVPWPSYQRS